MRPQAKACQEIDHKPEQAGWVIHDMKPLNLAACVGIAGSAPEHQTCRRHGRDAQYDCVQGAALVTACELGLCIRTRLFKGKRTNE